MPAGAACMITFRDIAVCLLAEIGALTEHQDDCQTTEMSRLVSTQVLMSELITIYDMFHCAT